MGNYDDIINLERPPLRKHSPMSMENRAAQFAPFAALSGYEAVIREAARQAALEEDARRGPEEAAWQELYRLLCPDEACEPRKGGPHESERTD